jgi:hypothetical protein
MLQFHIYTMPAHAIRRDAKTRVISASCRSSPHPPHSQKEEENKNKNKKKKRHGAAGDVKMECRCAHLSDMRGPASLRMGDLYPAVVSPKRDDAFHSTEDAWLAPLPCHAGAS